MKLVRSLSELSASYDVLLCDIWGVLHNGSEVFMNAFNALKEFKKHGYVALISNSPRPSDKVRQQIADLMNLDIKELNQMAFFDNIITSGDASFGEIKRRMPGPVFKLGPIRDDPLYEGLDLVFSDIESAKFISCTGLFDDEKESAKDYYELLSKAKNLELPMICVNPDLYVEKDNRLIACSGLLARYYEELGGEVIYSGKPHPPIYRQVFTQIEKSGFLKHTSLDKQRILAIGDGLKTDIAGANREEIDVIYITQGLLSKYETDLLKKCENRLNHSKTESISDLSHIKTLLGSQGLTAEYIMPKLV